jgi:polar amino acid transport system substrate-binding protein
VTRPLLVLLALTALLAGCATTTPPPPTPTAVRPTPAGTTVLTGPPPAAPDRSCDPEASLAPGGPAPAPGAMPPGSTMAAIVARGYLVVGVDQNTRPFGYRDPATGALAGFDIELAREMARALFGDPTRIRFRTESSAQRPGNLTSGAVDLVVQTMSVTCARRRQIQFSSVYYEAAQRVLVPRRSPVQSLADLGGRPVCSIASSTSIAAVQSAPSHPVAVAVPQKSDCLVLLQQGQVDAISTDDTILAGFAAEDPTLEVRGPSVGVEPYAIGVAPQHTELVQFVNAVLERVRADGTWARIYTDTYGAGVPVPAPPAARYRAGP